MTNYERIFLFDFDGTLTRKELLPEIGKKLGSIKSKQIAELTEMAIKGNVPYHENLRRRVEVLKEVPISEVKEIVKNIPLFEELALFVQTHSHRCRIVTANLDVWIEDFCSSLGVKTYMSSAIQKNDYIIQLKNVINKKEIASKYNNVVAIGDGHNDAGMMEVAKVGIACGLLHEPAESLFQVASHISYSEKSLCRILQLLL